MAHGPQNSEEVSTAQQHDPMQHGITTVTHPEGPMAQAMLTICTPKMFGTSPYNTLHYASDKCGKDDLFAHSSTQVQLEAHNGLEQRQNTNHDAEIPCSGRLLNSRVLGFLMPRNTRVFTEPNLLSVQFTQTVTFNNVG